MKKSSLLKILPVYLLAVSAHAEIKIPSYKDELFNYPQILESRLGGAERVRDYNEIRDVNGRDEIPIKKVKAEYMDSSFFGKERDEVFVAHDGTAVNWLEVGMHRGAQVVVIFAHGGGGTKALAMKDETFGGNFNRLKVLLRSIEGVYWTPTFESFGDKQEPAKFRQLLAKRNLAQRWPDKAPTDAQLAALIEVAHLRHPGARIILGCASSGGEVCIAAARSQQLAGQISGMVSLGAAVANALVGSQAVKLKIPVIIEHGTRDPLVPLQGQLSGFRTIKSADPGYPIRFTSWNGGIHGTPIRMVDWKESLEFILNPSK